MACFQRWVFPPWSVREVAPGHAAFVAVDGHHGPGVRIDHHPDPPVLLLKLLPVGNIFVSDDEVCSPAGVDNRVPLESCLDHVVVIARAYIRRVACSVIGTFGIRPTGSRGGPESLRSGHPDLKN